MDNMLSKLSILAFVVLTSVGFWQRKTGPVGSGDLHSIAGFAFLVLSIFLRSKRTGT